MCLTDVPTGKPEVMLHTNCTDCIVIKADEEVPLVMLLSKKFTYSSNLFLYTSATACSELYRLADKQIGHIGIYRHIDKYNGFATLEPLMCLLSNRQKTVSV